MGDVALIFIVVLVAVVFASVAVIGLMAATGHYTPDPHADPKQLAQTPQMIVAGTLAQSIAYLIALIFMYLLITKRYHVGFLEALHWKRTSNLPAYILGGGVLSIVVTLASTLLDIPKDLPIEKMFSTSSSAWTMAFFGIVVAPLMEELFFRGFLYPVLNRAMGLTGALIITSLLFAMIHAAQLALAWGLVMLLFGVGMVFTYARARTESLLPPYLLHVGYNGSIFVLIFIQTDGFTHMEKIAR
jgi:uncharacterized protein